MPDLATSTPIIEGTKKVTGEAEVSVPFDTGHRGFVPGQGAACLVLEAERSARARRVDLLAHVDGWAVGLDAKSGTSPDVHGEARVMATALSRARVDPNELDYVNPHGSGSALGDCTELAALATVLGAGRGRPLVNATKAFTGHCLGAAGVVEAVATVLQLERGFVHPTPGLQHPVEDGWSFVGDGPCRRVRTATALSASFGFGGFNAAIVPRTAE